MSANTAQTPTWGRRFVLLIVGAGAPLVLALIAYIVYAMLGVPLGVARVEGTVGGLGVQSPVRILRDARGVPHIRAGSVHDAMFAEGYVTGSDRLFQIDVTRRYMLGKLAELFGSGALSADEQARIIDLNHIVDQEYAQLAPADRDALQAFADGVNAAATHEPTPPEYRILLIGFTPWRPQDSLAVGFATVLALTDSWYDVIMRDRVARQIGPRADDAFFSLSDPKYDVPTVGGTSARIAPLPPLTLGGGTAKVSWNGANAFGTVGSNEWAIGAARTATGRALLANDPHLDRTMPGIWQLVDIEAPGYHVAGATLAGVPGVVLGHNDRVAWGATDAAATSPRVYTETFTAAEGGTYRIGATTAAATARTESFGVRGTAHATRTYYTTRHGFVLEPGGVIRHAVQWVYLQDRRSPLSAFFALDRAGSIDDAVRALSQYPGPTENFALADVSGQAGYTQAGRVPDNAGWGLHAYDGRTTAVTPLHFVPFTALPHVYASRGAFVVSANNLPYGAGYRYRLSPSYPPPYRANEIRRSLGTAAVSVASAHRAQTDLESIAERELAQRIVAALKKTGADRDPAIAATYAALAAFDGRMTTDSRAATAIQRIRTVAVRDLVQLHLQDTAARGYLADGPVFVTLLRALREHPRGWFPHDDVDAFLTNETRSAIALYGGSEAFLEPYGSAYAVTAQHPFAAFGLPFFNGPRVAGRGGSYAPAVQGLFAGQSFRAIWDVGNWDAGGIDIPIGESGEPGSPHYRDLAGPWAADVLTPLPYSDAAVSRAATATLTLTR